MSRSFNGTSDYLEYLAAARTALPVTLAGWFYTGVTNTTQVGVSLSTAAGTNSVSLRLINGALIRARSSNTSGTAAQSDTTSTYSANTWFHAAAVFTSNTSRTAYLNGSAATTNTTSNDPSASTFSITSIGNNTASSARANFYSGRIGEVGIWSVALTVDEIAALADGITPLNVRPASLIAYWPLYGESSPEIELRNRYEMTVSGAAKAENPRIFLPARGQYPQIVIVNQTVSVTGVEGTGAVGAVTTSAAAVVPVTGVSGTGEVGTATTSAAAVVPVTGVSGTGEVGTATVAAAAVVPVTGVAGTTALGTVLVEIGGNVTALVTGVSATGQVGTVTVAGTAVVIEEGVVGTTALGTVTATAAATAPVTGVEATTALGTVTVTGTAVVTEEGVVGTTALGTVNVLNAQVVPVTGVSGSTALGTVTVTGKAVVSVTGVSATGQLGTVNVTAPQLVPVTGVAGTTQLGNETVVAKAVVSPVGVSAEGQIGTVTFSTGAVVDVFGEEAYGELGQETFKSNVIIFPSGVSGTSQLGNEVVKNTLTGIQATGYVGYVTIWGMIDDNQTSGWVELSEAFQESAFQYSGFQVDFVNRPLAGWTPVNDTQSGSWTSIEAA